MSIIMISIIHSIQYKLILINFILSKTGFSNQYFYFYLIH